MIIGDRFYLPGFTRKNMGEDGAVFIRYAAEDGGDERKPEIRESPMYYGGGGTVNFVLSVPKPRPQTVTGCAIVTRTSKNCYSATAYDERRIGTFKKSSLNDLCSALEVFFAEKVRPKRA